MRAPRHGIVAAVLACLLVAACSSTGGRTATPGPTALRIPSPFEVGQQIGVGDLTLQVTCFRHLHDVLSARVTATASGNRPITLDATHDFTVFAGTQRRPLDRVVGPSAPIPAGGQASYELRFTVPARFRYPLLWFDDRRPGSEGETVVLRDADPRGSTDCRP